VNKRADLQTMTGDIVFAEFRVDDVRVRLYGDTGIVVGQGIIRALKGKQDLLGGKFVWTDTCCKAERPMEGGRFANHSGLGKIIADIYP
jgi:hypothetical protein